MSKKTLIKDILELSLPVIGEMTLYTLMWLIDMMLIGRYGGNLSVSIVGLCDEILYTFSDIFITAGICIGITSLVSRKIGGNQRHSAEEYATVGLICGISISLLLCLTLYLFTNKILIFAGTKNDLLALSNLYFKLSLPGIFFNLVINTICSILRGYGNTKTPLYVAMIVCSLKILLDLILIFGKLSLNYNGVIGAAIATNISELIGIIFTYGYISSTITIKFNLHHLFSISIIKFKEILFLSIPSSMEEAAFSISRLLSTFIIMHAGTIAFSANQIATSIESMSFMPGIGFGLATTTMVGFCVGEKNYKKAKKYAYVTTILTTLMMLTCSIIFLLIPNLLVSIFVTRNEKDVVSLATQCLMIGALEQPFMAIYMIIGGALKGYGDTKSPFIVSLISSWFIRLPLMFYFIYIKKFSVIYVWWITAIQWTFNAILMFILFKNRFKSSKKPF